MRRKIAGGCVSIECVVLGPLENNVYLIGEDDALVVVDPSCHCERILDAIGQRSVAAIVLTHRHWDHVGAAKALRDALDVPVIASAVDAPVIEGKAAPGGSHRSFTPCPVDRRVGDGDAVEAGGFRWRVIATPGHTPGGICLFLDSANTADPASASVLISGDTLFCGTHGRTDFEEGDPAAMRKSLRKLANLPDDTIVLPGHNAQTTIGAERWWLKSGMVGR